MAIDEEHLSEESGENTMLREAMDVLGLPDRGQACDLLVACEPQFSQKNIPP